MLQWIAGAWVAGLFVGARWEPAWGPLFVAFSLLGAFVVARHAEELRSGLWSGPLAALAFLAALGVTQRAGPRCSLSDSIEGTATVESARFRSDDASVRLRLREARLPRTGMRVGSGHLVEGRTSFEHAPPPGSIIALHAEIRPRTTLRNPSPHPSLFAPRAPSCWARWSDEQPLDVLEVPRWRRRAHDARARVRRHLALSLSEDAAAVARALVLGDGGALGYERREVIASVGLAHLFAVSGLHVALVSGTFVAALRWLLRGWSMAFDARRIAAAIGAPLTLLHAAFAGGSPSASRAALTASLTWVLVALGRRPSPPAVTAAAALVLSAPEPSMALQPAFLLSIVATSAILSAPSASGPSVWRWLRSAATVSARTLVATAPMVWWWFGGVPLVGWLANIVVLPLGSWVVIPLAHVVGATAWAPRWSSLPSQALEHAVRLLLLACELLSPLAVTRRLPPLDTTQGLIVLIACGLLLVLRRWRLRVAVIAVSAASWLCAEQALVIREQPRDVVRVTFVDVGQGDAALVDLPDGRLALIDTGQGGRHPAGRELRGLLLARRRTHIDLVVITHGHPDHFGGLSDLLEEFVIGEVWVNGQRLVEERDGAMEDVLQRALELGATIRFAPELCETTSHFGAAQIEVLWPCPRYDPALDLNDNSLTLRLSYGRHAFLFPGDLESEAERHLVDSGAIEPVDVLKVAHHGSRTSTTEPFLCEAHPRFAVISSGAGNRYGHPSPSVLARLARAGVEAHRTDLSGGLIITTDGTNLRIGG